MKKIIMSSDRRSMITDSDDSTDDLILKQEVPPPSGMLSVEPFLNYSVEVPNTKRKQRCSCLTKLLSVLLFILSIACVVFACLYFNEKHKSTSEASKYCFTQGCIEASAFMMSSMEETFDPCDDFYLYSCGGWLAKNPMPDGDSYWSIDTALVEKNQIVMKNILQNTTVKENSLQSKAEFKTFKLFRSCMNMETIAKLGAQPLKDLLSKIGHFSNESDSIMADVSSKAVLQLYIKNMHKHAYILPFFTYFIAADDTDSDKYVIKFLQSGLGLSQYHYANNDTSEIIQAYVNYLTELSAKIYDSSKYSKDTLQKFANETYHFEKHLQQIYVPDEERVTVDQTYHQSSFKNLTQLVPNIDWWEIMNFVFSDVNITLNKSEKIVLSTYKYFEKLGDLLNKTPLRVVLNHGIFYVASSYASYLNDDFQELKRNLSIADTGVFKIFPRWQKCVSATDAGLGMALGALFVKNAFSSKSHEEASMMVQQLLKTYIKSFDNLSWMDATTRKAATDKANAISQKIGYPKFILDSNQLDQYYKNLDELHEREYFSNELKIWKHEQIKELLKYRTLVDKTEWGMTPPTINAYYEPSSNQIVFPAGILQPPFFKVDYPKAVNYGSMGAVIGHEITHGFDNNGRLYDKNGNYNGKNSWWTQSSLDAFNERKKCFVEQYSQFTEAGVHIKGNVTLGENIADNGGLKAAYRAYKAWVQENGEEKLLPGLSKTNEQIFFIAFGQSWCTEELNARLVKQVETDVHAPAIDRVRGSVENNEDFARAFNCPLNSNMNPKKKCAIW